MNVSSPLATPLHKRTRVCIVDERTRFAEPVREGDGGGQRGPAEERGRHVFCGSDVQNADGEIRTEDIGCGRARTHFPDHEALCGVSEHQDDQDQRRHDGQMQAEHLTNRRRRTERLVVFSFCVLLFSPSAK